MPPLTPFRRTAFTEEDEINMCKYIAQRIPDPSDGGRGGMGIWKSLMLLNVSTATIFGAKLTSLFQLPEFSWGQRHTAQSWFEHYKRHRNRLDAEIACFTDERNVNLKTLYEFTRRPSKQRNPGLKKSVPRGAFVKKPSAAASSASQEEKFGDHKGDKFDKEAPPACAFKCVSCFSDSPKFNMLQSGAVRSDTKHIAQPGHPSDEAEKVTIQLGGGLNVTCLSDGLLRHNQVHARRRGFLMDLFAVHGPYFAGQCSIDDCVS